MKKIGLRVYESLTPRQRVIACVEAEARGDEDEKKRLITSCPKKTYSQNDIDFSEPMKILMGLAMAVEADLRESALGFFVALRMDPENALTFLQDISDIRAAWETTISAMGLDPKSMKKAGPPTSPILELIDGLVPKPVRKKSEVLAADMRKIVNW